jgi:phage replication-related protein YjqB (UPF0714/DUF867 family)
MSDTYASYQELSRHEKNGVDFIIQSRKRNSPFLIMAPHGGKIEKYTTDLAREIAGSDFSFYSFVGSKDSNNRILHIASHGFDEPKAVDAAANADIVITIHGQGSDAEEFLMIGGLHAALIGQLTRGLERSGFQCRSPVGKIHGHDPRNLCNRGRTGTGVQFEISHRLRYRLRDDVDLRNVFVVSVRSVLLSYCAESGLDADRR